VARCFAEARGNGLTGAHVLAAALTASMAIWGCDSGDGDAASGGSEAPTRDAAAAPDDTGVASSHDAGRADTGPISDAVAPEDARPPDLSTDGAADGALGQDADRAGPDAAATLDDAAPSATDAAGGSQDAAIASRSPGAAGPYAVRPDIQDEVTRDGRSTPVVAHVPDTAEPTPVPLVVFVPGYQIDAFRYASLTHHIASHGFVVVRADPPDPFGFGVDHVAMAADIVAVIDWALAEGGPLAGRVDPARVAVSGHSLGGKVATMVAHRDPRVTALLALDPVNAGMPGLGYSDALPDIVPEAVQGLVIPVGFVGETTNAEGGMLGQSCAPRDQNFQTFYQAAAAAPWASSWEIEGADHMDFVFDKQGCGLVCGACTEGPADEDAVRGIIRTLSVAFMGRHLHGDEEMEAYLTGDEVPAGVRTEHR